MSQPHPDDDGREAPRMTADPTLKVARPPTPGRAVRAEVAAGRRPTPPIHHDEPTVTLTPRGNPDLRKTLEFGTPPPVKVTVSPRPKPRRRFRTWPLIAAVVLALVVLGVVLLVMMWRGATIDGDTDLIGSARHLVLTVPPSSAG
jgi:hypothetical protein